MKKISNRKKKVLEQNLVAKYSREFNKPKVFVDRKKRTKKGYKKHANTHWSACSHLSLPTNSNHLIRNTP